jgi:hypothetical protein
VELFTLLADITIESLLAMVLWLYLMVRSLLIFLELQAAVLVLAALIQAAAVAQAVFFIIPHTL